VDTQNGFGGSFTVTLGLSDEVGHDRVMDAPIEENTIVGAAVVESVEKTKRAPIVEEDNLTGGRGAELAACIGESLFHCLEYPVRHVAAPDTTAALRSRAPARVRAEGRAHRRGCEADDGGLTGGSLPLPRSRNCVSGESSGDKVVAAL
jgi:pyruvate/2-oxoglutarate/acetoin dehydrogenase E1 component